MRYVSMAKQLAITQANQVQKETGIGQAVVYDRHRGKWTYSPTGVIVDREAAIRTFGQAIIDSHSQAVPANQDLCWNCESDPCWCGERERRQESLYDLVCG